MKIYDNGGKTLDRYTIFLDESDNCIGSDERGMGFYQHTTGTRGRHLGKIVPVESLEQELQEKLEYELSDKE